MKAYILVSMNNLSPAEQQFWNRLREPAFTIYDCETCIHPTDFEGKLCKECCELAFTALQRGLWEWDGESK